MIGSLSAEDLGEYGTNAPLTGRFAALRVRPAHRDQKLSEPRAREWLLIEWPRMAER